MVTLKSIQALRAVAAILVLLCHLFSIEQQAAGRAAPITSFWENGAYGVDLFFVISGFVIAWVGIDRGQGWVSAADFLSARVVRIYPSWWLFAGLMAIALWLTSGTPWSAERMTLWDMEGPQHLWRSFLLLPQAHHPVLGVGWTLVHEMYFYVVFALLICLVPARQRVIILGCWTAIVLFGGLYGFADEFAKDWVALIFYPMTLEFCAGTFVAVLLRRGVRRYAGACFWMGCLGFTLIFFGGDQDLLSRLGLDIHGLHVWKRTLTYGSCATLIVYGAVASELRAPDKTRVPIALVKLGDWSYALYLCHPLVISVIAHIAYGHLDLERGAVTFGILAVSVMAAITLAGLVYASFERPLIARFKSWRGRRRRPIRTPAAD